MEEIDFISSSSASSRSADDSNEDAALAVEYEESSESEGKVAFLILMLFNLCYIQSWCSKKSAKWNFK
jgi:hypothetical protein